MSTPEKTKVLVSHRTNPDIRGETTLEVLHLSPVARLMSAATALVVCWLAALVCVLIPVLHFVLVPLGLIAGLVAFVYKIRLHEHRAAAVFDCPACKAKVALKAGSFNWPLRETCNNCRTALTITQL